MSRGRDLQKSAMPFWEVPGSLSCDKGKAKDPRSDMTDLLPPPQRRLPIGAERLPDGSVHFRVWAPRRDVVDVTFDDAPPLPLNSEGNGYFSGTSKHSRAGTRYRFRLDGDQSKAFPDPASRFQPDGPHGPSVVVDPDAFRWTDGEWKGVSSAGQVLYEMHIGTFTPG